MESNKNKKERIIKLAGKGLSYSEIGRALNVSKQYIHQVYRGYQSPAWRKINRKLK